MRKTHIWSLVLVLALPCALSAQPYSEEAAAFAGTTGFIKTRPTCAPPNHTPDALNYLQGPEPIQLPNGDVTLLVGSGRCCIGTRHWEGLFSLNYPAVGRFASPRFRGLWATNDFSRLPNRKEAEVGFPSALFYGGKWRIALTTAFLPFHKPDRDRASRIDLLDLVGRASPSQVTNLWVKPINPACQGIASCAGDGSGLDLVLTLHPNGDLYLYHQDGRMLLLAEDFSRGAFIAEWSSEGAANEIGLNWKPTGRIWRAPAHPNGAPWGYYVRDAAFLKNATRTIVEPEVVVAQISDGTTFDEMADAQLGRWYLYYWADEGAVLPPTFGGPANGCAFQGALESSSCTDVRGWAWDPMFPSTPISVDVLADGVYLGTIPANQFRQDLVTTGRGDGRHGFVFPIPASLKNGKPHRITVRYAESELADMLPGKKQTITCR